MARLRAQAAIGKNYLDRRAWTRKAVINTARSWIFASDRTIGEYNDRVWHLDKVQL